MLNIKRPPLKTLLQTLLVGSMVFLYACSSKGPQKPTLVKSKKAESTLAKKEEEPDGPPLVEHDVTLIPNAIPRAEPLSRYGNPPTYTALGSRYYVMSHSKGYQAKGTASWYGRKFHGKRTSSGEPYDMFAMTAAHQSLPLPTYARVKNLRNGREVIVKINDRGPFVDNRLVDLSYAAAKKLGIYETGTGAVQLTAIDPKAWHKQQATLLLAEGKKTKPKSTGAKKTSTSTNSIELAKTNSATKIYIDAEQKASHATILTQALAHAGVNVLSDKVSDKDLFKVRIGPLKSKEEAQQLQKKLLALNGAKSSKLVYE